MPLKYVDAVARAGSIRRAAQDLAITSTALNRRILAIEEELGVQIFDRLPRGVRLSTAGELLIHHARTHISDIERLKSQIADLSGVRRGTVAIGATPVAMPDFLPEQIAEYRRIHPGVTFSARQRSREEAETALLDHSDDLALVFEPIQRPDFQMLETLALRPTIERLKGRNLVAIALDPRNIPAGRLFLGQLRGRVLPVASARFADQLARTFQGVADG